MSDPNAPRREEQHDPADGPVEGFSVTDEQHAAPSAPALGEPAQSFSSPGDAPGPRADAVSDAPGQPAFSSGDAAGQEWQHGQHQPEGGQVPAADFGQTPSSDYGQPASSAPQFGAVPPSQPYNQQQQQPGSAPSYGQSAPGQSAPGQSAPGQAGAPFGQQPPYGAPAGSAPQYGQQQYGAPGQPQYGAPGQPQYAAAAPMSPVDEKNAGMWGHLSGLSTIVTGGWGGWIGPLIVFLIYKDRSAFAKQESKEALNFGIFMTLLTIGFIIVGTLLSVVGIGVIFLIFYWLPGLMQVIFSIIGAMRVNNGGSYRYPFNWRLVK
ncbi:DUF4870 domain-containing protein [Agrococcus beijingensis]|uniref:DUF4870 domain-containing protein n=1 Tax=Agrococcus beijingensis TaxID=3068634 RepID=UPI0027418899|nr:DUF4870 domain-containing protein [Agrococcus sp. REN33]